MTTKKNNSTVRKKTAAARASVKGSAASSSAQLARDTVEEVICHRAKMVISVDVYNEEEIKRALNKQRAPKLTLKKLFSMEVPSLAEVGATETVFAFKHTPRSGARRVDLESELGVMKLRRPLIGEHYDWHALEYYGRVVQQTRLQTTCIWKHCNAVTWVTLHNSSLRTSLSTSQRLHMW